MVGVEPAPGAHRERPGRASSPLLLLLLLALPGLAFLLLPWRLEGLLLVGLHLVGFLSEVPALVVRAEADWVVLGVGCGLGVRGDLGGSSDLGGVDLCHQVVQEETPPQVLDGLTLVMQELVFRHGPFAAKRQWGWEERERRLDAAGDEWLRRDGYIREGQGAWLGD